MSEQLPEGWMSTKLRSVVELRYGKGLPESKRRAGSVPVYGSNGVVGAHDTPVTSGPTIIVGRKGSIGAVHLSPEPCWPIDTTYFVENFGPFDCAFLAHLLRTLGLSDLDSSTAIPGLTRDDAYELEVPVPPLSEQHRIVEKVQALLARVNAARERLAKVPSILKRFRQAVLAAACSGRLTEEWREAHPEIALTLPARPLTTAGARRGRRGANLSIEGELLLDGMPELPASWAYRRADEVVERGTVITYGIVLPGPEVSGGVPYVRQQDVLEDGTICMDQLRHTTTQIAARHDRSSLRAGDVLLCIIRNLRVGLVPQGLDGANITQGTVRMRAADLIRPEYLAAYLASPHAQEWMKERYFGMDMPRINVEDARAIPIAVPPLLEQDEVLRRIGVLLLLADAVHRRVEKGVTRANMLAQAVLTKAFLGELVPTEAELARADGRAYESASVLLERIRAGQTASPPPRAAGRRKRDSAQGRRAGRRAAQR